MTKKNIALFFGSVDSEHSVSVKSARSIFANFPHDAYECVPVYITQQGKWITGDFNDDNFRELSFEGDEIALRFNQENPGFVRLKSCSEIQIDGAFLALHGPIGEGGYVQGLLDMAYIPYSGSDVLASVTSMDKAITHQICEAQGVKMAPYQLIQSFDDINHDSIEYPVIVKPSREGSSYGVSSAHSRDELILACETAFKYDSRILIEKLIRGSEASIAVLDTKTRKLVSEPVQSIIEVDFLDFDMKYVSEEESVILFDSNYSHDVIKKLKKLSVEIFNYLGCRHLSRVDFFVTKDDDIYFNEINTIPGFTEQSFYPVLISNAGLPYPELLKVIIDDVVSV